MEELERQSWANMQTLLKTEEFLGIEYDENVICDVCRAVSLKLISFRLIFFFWGGGGNITLNFILKVLIILHK